MIIVFVADENYKQFLNKSLLSYRKYNPKARFIVVSEKPIDAGVENIVIPLDRTFRNRGAGDRISNTAYLKLFLTELPFDKILYVDCDTICQSPLNELWEMDCEYINIVESHSFGKKQAKAIGVEKYGCSGVMQMNLSNLRKIGFTKRCLDVEESGFIPATGWQHDETCINIGMKGLLTFIDKKWDYCHNRTYDEPIEEEQAKILHYIGTDKSDMLELPFYRGIKEVADYIKGKRVAIVGNAKSLFGQSYGKEIDSHEVIIRFNRGFIQDAERQGKNTSILMLACELNRFDIDKYNADYVVNRSGYYRNAVRFIISNADRELLKRKIGKQPSTGFMAIDLCLTAGAESIDLYGFAGNASPTFYNEPDYITQHDYDKEQEIIKIYEKCGLLKIN